MKTKQTDKLDSFTNWRINISQKLNDPLNIRSFVWIQVNYNPDRINNTCLIKSVLFEKKDKVNSADSLINKITERLGNVNIPSFIVDFENQPSKDLDKLLSLDLKIQPSEVKYESYWDYREATKPKNCLACDIDAFEVGRMSFVLIEAAELFNTIYDDEIVKNIIRTFGRRCNKVNPFQYIAQSVIAKKLNSKSYILFHELDHQKKLNEHKPVLLLKNDSTFHKMLADIADNYSREDEEKELILIDKYKDYLMSNIIRHLNIKSAYYSLGVIYEKKPT